jgi:phosphinothricin acetyltransferase
MRHSQQRKGATNVPDDAITIRRAQPEDAAAIAAIYNQGIRDRVATLETEERSPEERAAWLASHDERHPVFVAERQGVVAAWGSLNAFSPRPAYRWVADFSVYVDSAHRGHGLGGALLDHLIAEAVRLGFHKLVLAAFPFNEPGMRLYQSRGFRTVGIYHEQGQLDGQWVDTIIMERMLGIDGQVAMGKGQE